VKDVMPELTYRLSCIIEAIESGTMDEMVSKSPEKQTKTMEVAGQCLKHILLQHQIDE